MTIVNGIELHRRLATVVGRTVAGIALATGWCSLMSSNTLAEAPPSMGSHQSRAQSEAWQPQALLFPDSPTFSWAQQHPQQLAIRNAKLKVPNHRLRIHNLCSQTVEVVVRYQDHQQNWLIQGGTIIPAKHSRYLTSLSSQILDLSSKLLYYYATSPDSDLVWSGNGSHQYAWGEQTLNMRLHYAAIDVLDDYSLFILCAVDPL